MDGRLSFVEAWLQTEEGHLRERQAERERILQGAELPELALVDTQIAFIKDTVKRIKGGIG